MFIKILIAIINDTYIISTCVCLFVFIKKIMSQRSDMHGCWLRISQIHYLDLYRVITWNTYIKNFDAFEMIKLAFVSMYFRFLLIQKEWRCVRILFFLLCLKSWTKRKPTLQYLWIWQSRRKYSRWINVTPKKYLTFLLYLVFNFATFTLIQVLECF